MIYVLSKIEVFTQKLNCYICKHLIFMLKKIILLIVAFVASFLNAQTYEIGLQLGQTNFVGDVGNTTIVRPQDTGFGILTKWNRSDRHSFRASFSYLPISADDNLSSDPSRQARNFKFENSIKELSLGIEYTFWEWNLHTGKKQTTPYLYTGINVINYGDLALTPSPNRELKAFEDAWGVAIPMVIGIKTTLGQHFVFSFEMGARYAFTDNIDGSNPSNLNLDSVPGGNGIDLNFGNQNNNDWYFFNSISLTYTFGRRPCYCVF